MEDNKIVESVDIKLYENPKDTSENNLDVIIKVKTKILLI